MLSVLASVIRITSIVALSAAAIASASIWFYTWWPYNPPKYLIRSQAPPYSATAYYWATPSEWDVFNGVLTVQQHWLVSTSFSSKGTISAGRFYAELDVYAPRKWSDRRLTCGIGGLRLSPPPPPNTRQKLEQFNLAVLELRIPLWGVVLFPSIYPCLAILRRRVRRRYRRRRTLCVNCAYNLTGNASGVCPECGTEVPERAHHGARDA